MHGMNWQSGNAPSRSSSSSAMVGRRQSHFPPRQLPPSPFSRARKSVNAVPSGAKRKLHV